MKKVYSSKIQLLLMGLAFLAMGLTSCKDDIPEDSLYTYKAEMLSDFLRNNENFSQFARMVEKAGKMDLGSDHADINHWFPEFSIENSDSDIACLICCESKPACLFLGKEIRPGEIEVLLDYATPPYRDTSVGTFLYKSLAGDGYKSLIFRQKAENHIPYLKKIGYETADDGSYVLTLKKLFKH